jgi:hypothetical protein
MMGGDPIHSEVADLFAVSEKGAVAFERGMRGATEQCKTQEVYDMFHVVP